MWIRLAWEDYLFRLTSEWLIDVKSKTDNNLIARFFNLFFNKIWGWDIESGWMN